jgi:hypothetical protein
MATIREYFDTDPRALTQHKDWECRTGEGKTLFTVRAKIAYDFEANAKYWYFFLPEVADPQGWLRTLLMADETKKCVLSAEGETAYVEMGFADYPEKQTNASMIFTGRVFLYVDMELAPELGFARVVTL